MNCIALEFRCVKQVALLVWLVGFFLSEANALIVQPSELRFEARIGDTLLLTIEVNFEENSFQNFTVDIEGFRCDRRIKALGDGKYLVQIAPDTDIAGNVQGTVHFKDAGKVLGKPIPVSGIVRPWIRAQPSKFFIGSIGQGAQFKNQQTYSVTLTSDDIPFDIEKIEFEKIVGTSWKCEPPQGQPSQTKRLQFIFCSDAVAANFPFGALATKYILVSLTHEKTPRLVIPIMGMLSVNTTGRDYSKYLYEGNLRWQGPWETPNMAAAFLAGILVLLATFGAILHKRFEQNIRAQTAVGLMLAIPVIIDCCLLAQTYSRGGWIAACAGILTLMIGVRGARAYSFVILILLAAVIWFQPTGYSRAISSVSLSEDKSIHHRLLLWKGALQMMAEHPWTGIGVGNFSKVFTKEYRLPDHRENYSTAVNDFLTLAVERGIPLFALIVSSLVLLAVLGLWLGMREGRIYLVGCGATIVTMLVASWFSSIAFQCNSSWLLIAAAFGIASGAVWPRRIVCATFSEKLFLMFAMWGMACGALIGMCLLAGLISLSSRPSVQAIKLASCQGLLVSPRWTKSKGTLFYIGDRGDTPEKLLQTTLRPLAQKGWAVYCIRLPEFTSDALPSVKAAVIQLREMNCLAGHGRGAELAIACGEATPSKTVIACYLTPLRSPFSDLSAELQIKTLDRSLLICTQGGVSNSSFSNLQNAFADSVARKHNRTLFTYVFTTSDWRSWINVL